MAQRSVYQHIVLNTIAASAGDWSVKNQTVYIQGVPFFKFDDVIVGSIVKETAVTSETAGVVTFTVASSTPAYNTTYAVTINVSNPNATGSQSNPIVQTIAVTTPASGTLTPTTVTTQFKAAINAAMGTYVTASGTSTLVITGNAGYPVVTGSWATNPDASTVTQTTQGVPKSGTPAAMQALGVASSLTTGTAYTLYSVLVNSVVGEGNGAAAKGLIAKMLWLNQSDGNCANLVTQIDLTLAGYSTGTTVDHLLISTNG